MENQVKDIIIKALQDAGYDVEIDNRMFIVDDYDTNNGVAVKIEALPQIHPMDNRYNHRNRRKYSLKVHIVLVTKYRKQILKGSIADDAKQQIYDICNSKGYGIIAMETDKDHIHFLISYDTTERVCDIVKLIKQQTTHYLWQKYPNFLSKCYWKHKIFWSDGYFVCSIGEVSSATIQKYIENQG